MAQRPMISVVVPVFNELGTIEPLADRIASVLDPLYSYEIVWVNDGSTDGSSEKLDELARARKCTKVVHFRRNFGQTAAMMAGFNNSSGQIIVPLDADLQNDPSDIPMLVQKLEEGYDVCSGWRRDRQDKTLSRVIPSIVANRLISWISGVRLNDYGCTLKAYKREVLEDVRLYGEMHRFVPIYASWNGAKVTELPVHHNPRTYGESKYGVERIFKVILDLVVVKFLSDYSQKPIYVFGGFGMLCIAGAFGTFSLMLYYKYLDGRSFIMTPLPSLVIMLFLLGFMSILMGLLAELCVRIYYETQGRTTYKISRVVESEGDTKGDSED